MKHIFEQHWGVGEMARIDIEEDFWLDVADVIERHPDQDKVIGNAIRFFRYAQQKHKKGQLISEEAFKEKGFLEALIPTFAKRTPSGIQAVGAEKHFGWLSKKIEAGSKGGKKSAKRPRDKQGRLLKKETSDQKELQADSKHHQPSPFPSYSPFKSPSPAVSSKQTKAGAFIIGYKTRFEKHWGAKIDVEGEDHTYK